MEIKSLNLANQNPNFSNIVIRETTNNYTKYIPWTDNNNFPNMLLDLSTKSTTHQSMLNVKNNGIQGDGWESVNEKTYKSIFESQRGTDFLSLIASDLSIFDSFAIQIVWSRDGSRIAKVYHIPVHKVRIANKTVELENNEGENFNVKGYYYSDKWGINNSQTQFYPELNNDEEFRKQYPSQILYCRLPNSISQYYAIPSYISAINLISLEEELGIIYYSTTKNAAIPANIFSLPGKPETEEEKDAIYSEFNKAFGGADNAGRFMVMFTDPDSQVMPEINKLETGIDDQMFSHYSEEARQKIITAHNATSPVLAGVPKAGSIGGDGKEIEIAWKIFNKMVISKYHRLIEDTVNEIFQYNDLEQDYKIKKFTTN
jgi:hypothetical protein